MIKKVLLSLGKLLCLGVFAVIVLKRYREIFSLTRNQSIILVLCFVAATFSAVHISDWLGKHVKWKESTVEWCTVAVLVACFGSLFAFFVL